jgi:hypothetical protein
VRSRLTFSADETQESLFSVDEDFVVMDRSTSPESNKSEYRTNFKEGIFDGREAFARR